MICVLIEEHMEMQRVCINCATVYKNKIICVLRDLHICNMEFRWPHATVVKYSGYRSFIHRWLPEECSKPKVLCGFQTYSYSECGVSHLTQVGGDIPTRVKRNAHELILDFIRSRPPLKPVSSSSSVKKYSTVLRCRDSWVCNRSAE